MQVTQSEAVRYAAMAEYICREIFACVAALHEGEGNDSKTCHEMTRADIKRVLRDRPFFNLCRKLGFGVEGR